MIVTHDNGESLHQGIITLPEGLLMFTSQPILTSENQGPIMGSLIFTKIINTDLINKLATQTELTLSAFFIDNQTQSNEVKKIIPLLSKNSSAIQKVINDKLILGYGLLNNITDSPAILLRIDDSRSIFQQGISTRHSANISLITTGAGVTVLILFLLEYSVISRLHRLNKDVSKISTLGDSSQRVSIKGKDEISELSQSINKMLQVLNHTEEILRSAKEAALAANQAKSHFVANVSHEIRTPINGILGMTEVLKNIETSSEKREYLGIIKQSSETLLYIINEILDFSKIEAGKLSLEEIPFQFRELIRNTFRGISLKAFEKGIEVLIDIDSNIPETIIGDPIRLRQIFTNLIGNAIKFTEFGEIIFSAKIISIKDKSINLEFRIKDTGIGIPEDRQLNLFNPFTQADESTTRKYGGTGLGLSITCQLIELMHGSITLESKIEAGTTFICQAQLKIPKTISPNISLIKHIEDIRIIILSENSFFKEVLTKKFLQFGIKKITYTTDNSLLDQTIIVIDRDPLQSINPYLLSSLNSIASRKIIALLPPDKLAEMEYLKSQNVSTILIKPTLPEEILASIYSILDQVDKLPEPLTPFSIALPNNISTANKKSPALKILVADDAKINQKVLKLQLEQMGHIVELANNGVEVISLLEKNEYFSNKSTNPSPPFDLILMDGDMPEIDGLEATRIIREKEKLLTNSTIHLPIIAVTAHAAITDKDNFLLAGMDDYLTKPIDPIVLLKKINSLITSKSENLVYKLGNTINTLTSNLRPKSNPNKSSNPNLYGVDILNFSDLLQRFNSNLSFIFETIDIFFEEHEELINDLIEALKTQEISKIRKSAHALKGSFLNISASGGAMVAHCFEKIKTKEDLATTKEFLILLLKEVENIKQIFRELQKFESKNLKSENTNLSL